MWTPPSSLVVEAYAGRGDTRWVRSVAALMPPGPVHLEQGAWDLQSLRTWALAHGGQARGVVLCLSPSQRPEALIEIADDLGAFSDLYAVAPDTEEAREALDALTAALPQQYRSDRTWGAGTAAMRRTGWHQRYPGASDAETVRHPSAAPASASADGLDPDLFRHLTLQDALVSGGGEVWHRGAPVEDALFGGRRAPLGPDDLAQALPGRTYYLGQFRNYYHFVVDVLLMLVALPVEALPDRFLVAKQMPFHQQWLDLLGFGGTPLVVLPPDGVRCAELTLPRTLASTQGRVPARLVDAMVSRAGGPVTGPPLVYVTRRYNPRRRLLNEAACEDLVRRRGGAVVAYEGLSVADQLAATRGARTIIGPHGAGLTNLVMMPRGAQVVELTYPGQPDVFADLAASTGHSYTRITGTAESSGGRRDDDTWSVDLGSVEAALDRAMAGPVAP